MRVVRKKLVKKWPQMLAETPVKSGVSKLLYDQLGSCFETWNPGGLTQSNQECCGSALSSLLISRTLWTKAGAARSHTCFQFRRCGGRRQKPKNLFAERECGASDAGHVGEDGRGPPLMKADCCKLTQGIFSKISTERVRERVRESERA